MSEAGLRPLSKKSLRDEAYYGLRQAIISGSIPPGEQLSEPQLASQFQISRSPIREALGRLEQEGFAIRHSNGRISVAPLDETELEQLYIVRANLEGLAARLAASRLDPSDFEEMEEHLRLMRERAEKGDLDGSLERGEAFHDVILRACENPPLVELISTLRLRISRFRTVIASARNQQVRVAEHWHVLEALRDRKGHGAQKAMERHIMQSAEIIVRAMRSDG
jgi:DNA-binding GntR family transcriptional regulator